MVAYEVQLSPQSYVTEIQKSLYLKWWKGREKQPAPNHYSKGHLGLQNIHSVYKLTTITTIPPTTATMQNPNQKLNLN